jgi:hypothetical protein
VSLVLPELAVPEEPEEGEEPAPVPEPVTLINVSGYVCDIGPETCNTVKFECSNADIVFVWGTAGVCELSAFQTGQRALVSAINRLEAQEAREASEEEVIEAVSEVVRPAHSIVVGFSSVEWTTRMIDGDGELQGDLIAAGSVSYTSRNAASFCGRLASIPAAMLNDVLRREPIKDVEFNYQGKVERVEEEEEEE